MSVFTFSGSTSKPVTLKRSPLKSSASGKPTYPIPTMPIRACRDSIFSLRPASRLSVTVVMLSIVKPEPEAAVMTQNSRSCGLGVVCFSL